MKCLNCQKAVNQTPGKRPKLYCSPKCKAEYFKKKQPVDPSKRGPGRPKKSKENEEWANGVLAENQKNHLNNFAISMPTGVVPGEKPKPEFEYKGVADTKLNNEAILKEIEAIKSEKIPTERNTSNGRKSWAYDQKKRIQELESKLK